MFFLCFPFHEPCNLTTFNHTQLRLSRTHELAHFWRANDTFWQANRRTRVTWGGKLETLPTRPACSLPTPPPQTSPNLQLPAIHRPFTIQGSDNLRFFRHVKIWDLRQTDSPIYNTGVSFRRPVLTLGLKHVTHTGLYLDTQYHRFVSKFRGKVPPTRSRVLLHTPGLPKPWPALCPLATFTALANAGLLQAGCIFPPRRLTTPKLKTYMHTFCRNRTNFSPHSLRIGGHTFYTLHNMHEDFVHYLGRRSIRRASQRYYRANPVDNIRRLRTFFNDVSTTAPFMRGLYGAPK